MTATSAEVKRKTGDGGRVAAAGPLSADELRKMHAYWRAANYLSVGQIYLMDNPLLKEPLQLKHVKPRLHGHWGTTSGQNFLYVHLNPDGRVMEMLSEHQCQGWLEGYLLTGRHNHDSVRHGGAERS